MPSTTVKTWPTVAEFEAVADALGGDNAPYIRIEGLTWQLERLVDLDVLPTLVDGVTPPTMETLGALTSCLARLRFDLEYALTRVRTMELQRDAMALEVVS